MIKVVALSRWCPVVLGEPIEGIEMRAKSEPQAQKLLGRHPELIALTACMAEWEAQDRPVKNMGEVKVKWRTS